MEQNVSENASPTSATNSPAILELLDVVKYREQGGIAFELHIPKIRMLKGQFVAVVGNSGCGKSTLLDMLALVSRPTRCQQFKYFFSNATDSEEAPEIGELWQKNDEQKLADLRREKLGYVLQTGGLLPFLTVLQNIQLPLKLNGYQDDTYIRTLAERLDIDTLLNKKPQFLSGGQRQRVAVLRALSHHPQIILADEPTAAVDEERAKAIVQDFSALAKDTGTTIIMVTHHKELVKPLANITYTFKVEDVSKTLIRSTCEQLN
jgi:putative ABC transport system ATP-binding protein